MTKHFLKGSRSLDQARGQLFLAIATIDRRRLLFGRSGVQLVHVGLGPFDRGGAVDHVC